MSVVAQSPAPPERGNLSVSPQLRTRKGIAGVWQAIFLVATLAAIGVLVVLLVDIWDQGNEYFGWNLITEFSTSSASRVDEAGFQQGLIGTLWIVSVAAVFSIPVGIGAAIYLEEYAPDNWLAKVIQINIANLAGVPSIVYGLLGLGVFVYFFGYDFIGRTVLSGGLTLGLLILPIVIIASQEAIRAVPLSLRQAAFALGATPWQVARSHVLPAALPGILTGIILAVSRAVGETAPLIAVGAASYINYNPDGLLSGYTALPIQVFGSMRQPQEEVRTYAAAGIILMLIVLLLLNAVAIVLRERASRQVRW